MKPNIKRFVLALVSSVAVTLGLFGLAFVCAGSHEQLARILYWQGYSLQSLIPAPNIGTAEHPLYEGTPAHMVAFFAGIPVGVIIYFMVIFLTWPLIARYLKRNALHH